MSLKSLRLVAGLGLVVSLLSGCSVFSPLPLWELAKAGGQLATTLIDSAPSQATGTVRHEHAPITSVCIELSHDNQSADLLPALQGELLAHQVQSRVYATDAQVADCPVWLHYQAYIEWGRPPFSDVYRPFLNSASLVLRSADGRVIASSQYELDGVLSMGKWGDTRSKIAPMVTALLSHPTAS